MWWVAAALAAEPIVLPSLVFPLGPESMARPGRWLDHEFASLPGDAIAEPDPEAVAYRGVLTYNGLVLDTIDGGYGAWSWQALPGSSVRVPADGVVVEVAQDLGQCGPLGLDAVVIATPLAGAQLVQVLRFLTGVEREVGDPVMAGEEIGLTSACGLRPLSHEVRVLGAQARDGGLRIDPFGWTLPGPDPIADEGGAQVGWLWTEAEESLEARLGLDRGLPWQVLAVDVRVRYGPVGGGR